MGDVRYGRPISDIVEHVALARTGDDHDLVRDIRNIAAQRKSLRLCYRLLSALFGTFFMKGFAASRAYLMKSSARGLSVRFFSVTIATGLGRCRSGTGNIFNESRSAFSRNIELAVIIKVGPAASRPS